MPERGLPSRVGARPRHVPEHAARRNGRAFLAYFALGLLTLSTGVARGERAGSAAQVIRGIELRKGPSEESASKGRLPKGTVVTLTGDYRDGFVAVEVELEEGSITGWVPKEVLNRAARDALPEDDKKEVDEDEEELAPKKRRRTEEPDEEEPVVTRPRSRIRVPKDEGVLLRRDSTFFYGIQAGGGLSILQVDPPAADLLYGFGFGAGGHVGYYLSNSVTVRAELSYLNMGGTDASGTIPNPVNFGFIDMAAIFSYFIDDFELFAGLSYAIGISISDVPATVRLNGAVDLSTLLIHAGGGYRFPLSDVTSVIVRARYIYGFTREPVGISGIQGAVFLEFRG